MTGKLEEVFGAIENEFHRSVELHGSWDGYSAFDVHKAVCDEFREYSDAVIAADVHGAHGQIAELLQLANVAIKGVLRLRTAA